MPRSNDTLRKIACRSDIITTVGGVKQRTRAISRAILPVYKPHSLHNPILSYTHPNTSEGPIWALFLGQQVV